MTSRKAFIIDVDNTLINTDGIKAYWFETLHSRYKIKKNIFINAYTNAKSSTGFLDIYKLGKKLNIDSNFFENTPFQKFLFGNALNNIKKLKKLGKVIIFSLGEEKYQKIKIQKSGIEKVAGKKNVIIVRNKKTGLKSLINKIKKDKFTDISIVDDVSNILTEAKKIDPQIITVWVRFGRYKNRLPLMRSAVTFEASTFTDAANYLERFVSNICLPASKIKLSILKDIDENQIHTLISYTKTDKKIKKYTHDYERFKNLKTFKTWKSRKKIIYVLINKHGKLQGIIWFGKKSLGKFQYTFAIRTYPPIRGKGLAKKFMNPAIQDFRKNNKGGIWLKTEENNLRADKLYESFGFKKIPNTGSREIIMTLPD
jgi:GNAT superfamily N-acetyltransferase